MSIKPILVNSEYQDSDVLTPALNNKIFSKDTAVVAHSDFATESTVTSTSVVDSDYHSTKNVKAVTNFHPDPINTIVNKLDVQSDNSDLVTKEYFTALIGELRVDILTLAKAVGALNSNVTVNNDEQQKIKQDVCKLVDKTSHLEDRFSKFKEEESRRYDTLCKSYDAKLEEFQKQLTNFATSYNRSERYSDLTTKSERSDKNTSISTTVSNVIANTIKQTNQLNQLNQSNQSNIQMSANRSVNTAKKFEGDRFDSTDNNGEIVNENESENTENTDNANEQSDSQIKMINDSQMESRAIKIKQKKPRTRTTGSDVFGTVEQKLDEPVLSGAFRQINRQEKSEDKVKNTTDSKTVRANRLKLQGADTVVRNNRKTSAL